MIALPIRTITITRWMKKDAAQFSRVFLLPMLTGRNVIEIR